MPTIPTSCTVCTGTCVSECGESCIGGCSKECIDACTGTCSGSCMLECSGSCKIECSNVCGNACVSSCESECISSCLGMCQGCTGCSGTCEGTCVSSCLNSCQNEATNSGTRVVTENEVLNYIANLKFKRISDFNENPGIFKSDMFATVVDGTLPTYDALNAVSILMESKEKKAFRATAGQLMDFLNRNLRNFVMWKPYSDGSKIWWERTSDNSEPKPIDLVTLNFPLASETKNGIMSSEDFKKLKAIDITNYYTKTETDTIVSNLATVYAPIIHVHDQYLTIENAKNTYYDKDAIDNKLAKKSDTTHNHDDVYLKISVAENDYATKELLRETLKSYTDTTTMSGLLDEKLNISDAFTIDQIPLASESVNGFMSSTHYSYIESIPTKLQNIKNAIPTTTGELVNDAEFLVVDTLPIAGVDTLGIACVSGNSRATISNGYIDIKDFGTVNFVRNSTFASGSDNWTGIPVQDAILITEGNGECCAKFTFNSGLSIYQTLNGIWGDYATFSMEIKGTGTLTIELNGESEDISFNSTEWTRYQSVFAVGNMGVAYDTDLVITNNTEDSIEVYIRHIMVQNGLFATEWFPNYFDGNTISKHVTDIASNETFGVVKPDNTTIVSNNGIISAISEIDDGITSTNKTWSSSSIVNAIDTIPNLRLIGTANNSIPSIRIVDSYTDSGYGVIINKTSDKFIIGVTNANDPFGGITDEIGLRIDLTTGICDINGNAMTAYRATSAETADSVTNDIDGNPIITTYLKAATAETLYMPINRIGTSSVLGGVKSGGDITINADGTMTVSSFDSTLGKSVLPINKGGTGANTAAQALINFGITATASELNILDGITSTTSELNILHGVTATATEINLLKGVTAGVQSQLDNKSNKDHTHYYAKSSTIGGSACNVELTADVTDSVERNIWFSSATDSTKMTQVDKFRYNPVTDTLVVGNILGNISSADKLSSPRNIQLSGDATGNVEFDGTKDVVLSVNIGNDTHTHDGRYYTKEEIDANYVSRAEYDAAIADINEKLAALA